MVSCSIFCEFREVYVKSQDLKNFKNEISEWKKDVEKATTENTKRDDEITEQVYQKILSNIQNEWDLKIR